jgi:hypothetical protein
MMTDQWRENMTTITRTVTMIRAGKFNQMAGEWFERQLAAFIRWAISKRAVQEAIAEQFSGATPMCRVLKDAIDSAVDGLEVPTPRDIEEAVDSALQHFEIDCENVKGLDSEIANAVDQAVEDDDRVKAIVDNVCETIAERICG